MSDASDDTLPWERQPGESARAFRAFAVYRDMGLGRTLEATGRQVSGGNPGRKKGTTGCIRNWYQKFNWAERARAWDNEQDRIWREQQTKARKEMLERHVKQAKALQLKAIERIARMKPDELKPGEVLDYFIQAAKMERLCLGEPTEAVEQKADSDVRDASRALSLVVKGATDEELERLRTNLAAIVDRVRPPDAPPGD